MLIARAIIIVINSYTQRYHIVWFPILATHLQILQVVYAFVWRCNIPLVSQFKLSEILVVHLCLEKIDYLRFVVLLEKV